MPYDPEFHHRRSMRLPGYDCAEAGMYFVTICTRGRLSLFGDIIDGVMRPSLAGIVIEQWWRQLPERFPDLGLDAFVVMPNLLHGIILLGGPGAIAQSRLPLSHVVQWFKSITTADYRRGVSGLGWPPFDGRLWQRNYYEHIIRTDTGLNRIRAYVVANPANWESGTENPSVVTTASDR